jgi:adenylylsulfate kinase-like enzyme
MKTVAINFYGGPGSGKSTMAAAVFAELKSRNVEVELVT